ncbi:MAG: DNA polymerase III subunit beta [Candidatus Omnitrophica bacterium]|nr:DNA polymerase III subunit beta [Candidatus Omnitrophota bacterium]
MKFNVSKDVLLKRTQIVQNAINPKSTLPILSNILIEAKDNNIVFVATNLDLGIISTESIKPQLTGSVTIPAKKFFDIIKELPDTDIMVSVKKNNLIHMECQQCVFKIMGLPKDEFPQIPEFKDKDGLAIEQKTLKKMLDMTSFAMSHDETRYTLNGILFIIKPSYLRLVATDGRRLAMAERKMQFPKNQERKFIVPAKAINELSKLLTGDGEVKIFFTDNQVLFDVGATKMAARLIDGEFPPYEQVIPKEVKEKMSVSREKMLAAARRVALFTNAESLAIKMDLSRDKLIMSKSTPYLGEAREELGVEYKGKELSIGFNPDYLIDVLKNVDQETVQFELTDAEKAGAMRIGDEYVYVVLPMQVG